MRTIDWAGDHIDVIDQTALPPQDMAHWQRVALRTVDEVVHAIAALVVRGAPGLGVLGALGVALAARHGGDRDGVRADAERIAAARPTAVNLRWGVEQALAVLDGGPDAVLAVALRIAEDDVAACAALSASGARLLRERVGARPMRLLTHCNAGALACVEWGTALGVVRALHDDGLIDEVLVGETRPLLQGSRITAAELAGLGVPHRVVVDGAGPGLIAAGMVDAVVVGADRIAANADVVNKVGSYPLALAAARAGVPFVVAAPESTVDQATPDGASVPIEWRGADEVLLVGDRRMAPAESGALNPAFDVTPADLVTAIVTERRTIIT